MRCVPSIASLVREQRRFRCCGSHREQPRHQVSEVEGKARRRSREDGGSAATIGGHGLLPTIEEFDDPIANVIDQYQKHRWRGDERLCYYRATERSVEIYRLYVRNCSLEAIDEISHSPAADASERITWHCTNVSLRVSGIHVTFCAFKFD